MEDDELDFVQEHEKVNIYLNINKIYKHISDIDKEKNYGSKNCSGRNQI